MFASPDFRPLLVGHFVGWVTWWTPSDCLLRHQRRCCWTYPII